MQETPDTCRQLLESRCEIQLVSSFGCLSSVLFGWSPPGAR